MASVMRGSWGLVLVATSLLGRLPAVEAIEKTGQSRVRDNGDLVFGHIPYNFGYTIGGVAMFGSGNSYSTMAYIGELADGQNPDPDALGLMTVDPQTDGAEWGHFNQDLHAISTVTGCSLYNTPPKHWPDEIRDKYFRVHTEGIRPEVFGVLRDPYERLVAIFRGRLFGADYEDEFKTCDVNTAVKRMMQSYMDGSKYMGNCTLLPQDEFFNGAYGITIPVDNRRFPQSMNEVFKKHGYSNMLISPDDVLHVEGCNTIWAADLDTDTRAMVREVYASDFDLLCRHFNYCEWEEAVCLKRIDKMCPSKAFRWDASRDPPQYVAKYLPRPQSSSSRPPLGIACRWLGLACN